MLSETLQTPTTKDGRNRFQFKFWLNSNKPDDFKVGLFLEQQKAKRKMKPWIVNIFKAVVEIMNGEVGDCLQKQKKPYEKLSRMIVDGVKLYSDLSKGDIDVLTAMFPGIVDKIKASVDSPASSEFEKIVQQQAAILEKLSEQRPLATVPALPAPGATLSDTAMLPSIFTTETIKISSEEVRGNFTSSMGDLFADDGEDFWT